MLILDILNVQYFNDVIYTLGEFPICKTLI